MASSFESSVSGPLLDTEPGHRDALTDVRPLIVDDNAMYRDSMGTLLVKHGAAVPSVAWDLHSVVAAFESASPPNIVLLNIDTRDSLTLLRATLSIRSGIRVIALGMAEDDEATVVACAEAGIAGYHLRSESIDDLLALIRKVANGELVCPPRVAAILLSRLSTLAAERQPAAKHLVLTDREAQILRMVEMGLSNRDIANQLCIAVHTVKNHVHSMLTKLGVSNRAEAGRRFREFGMAEADRRTRSRSGENLVPMAHVREDRSCSIVERVPTA